MNNGHGLNIPIEHVQRYHRVGPRINSRVTRNILRFRDYRSRQSVFHNKRKLKGTDISITKNLTKKRMELYKLAIAKYGRGEVWILDCRVKIKLNDKYNIISTEANLN